MARAIGPPNERYAMTRVLLLHGGAHGAWCWERVLEPLRAAGHEVETIDLPGRGADAARARTVTLEDHARHVSEVIDTGPVPVVLVAHSLGGVTASVVTERRPDDIARLVFVAALAPGDGDATLVLLQSRAHDSRLLAPGGLVLSDDQLLASVTREAAIEGFYRDCTHDDAEWAIARLCPEPLAPLMTPVALSPERYGRVPKSYVVTTDDPVVPTPLQYELADAAGAEIVELASGHSPFVSAVDPFVACLKSILARRPGVVEPPSTN